MLASAKCCQPSGNQSLQWQAGLFFESCRSAAKTEPDTKCAECESEAGNFFRARWSPFRWDTLWLGRPVPWNRSRPQRQLWQVKVRDLRLDRLGRKRVPPGVSMPPRPGCIAAFRAAASIPRKAKLGESTEAQGMDIPTPRDNLFCRFGKGFTA